MGFSEEIKKFKIKTTEKADQIAKKVGMDLHSRIIARCPVDTGRLRANNQLAIGAKPSGTTTSVGVPSSGAISSYTVGDDIWIANNLEYAVPVEYGGEHGKRMQRPEGFFRVSIKDVTSAWPSIVQSVANE